MTVHFPDISGYQSGISLAGAPAACIKATEGASWANSDFGPALGRARAAGAFAMAYHFLHAGSPAAQAAHAHAVAGGTPLMLDTEPAGSSRPSLGDACAFTDAYRQLGGTCSLVYFPRWYWGQLGSPSLAPLARRGCSLWSSAYTAYTDDDHGAGWMPYGGMTPSVWQYTDSRAFSGQRVDFSAFRGTLDGLRALAGYATAPPPPPPPPPFPYPAGHYLGQPSSSPYCHSGYFGGHDTVNVHAWQAQMARRGWTGVTQDGCYGPESERACRAFQAEKNLSVDGLVGPATWKAAWTARVTP
jgi:Glycosyl hydrolases family 25/Putative peptidoglycan binding domain